MIRSCPIIVSSALAAQPATRLAVAMMMVLGLVVQGLLPGLDIALLGELPPSLFGAGGTGICHSPAGPGAVAASEGGRDQGQTESHGCCLVCQAATQAAGTPPSPTFTHPTTGTASILVARADGSRVDGRASRQNLARAPPAGVA